MYSMTGFAMLISVFWKEGDEQEVNSTNCSIFNYKRKKYKVRVSHLSLSNSVAGPDLNHEDFSLYRKISWTILQREKNYAKFFIHSFLNVCVSTCFCTFLSLVMNRFQILVYKIQIWFKLTWICNTAAYFIPGISCVKHLVTTCFIKHHV